MTNFRYNPKSLNAFSLNFLVSYKTKQFFFVLIKLSIVVGAFYFMYSKLAENENLNFNEFITFLKENDPFSVKTIIFLVILSIFNWFFEILKWYCLVKTIKQISFKTALEQSLGGLTASLITPNRIGDYGAKAIYYAKPFRPKIVLLNLLGHMAQMTITTIFGVVGAMIFVNRYQIVVNYYNIILLSMVLVFIGLIVVLVVKQKRIKIKGFSIERVIGFVKKMDFKTHIINLSLSLIRYFIFSFQFYYLLTLFGVDLDYSEAMIIITSLYFLASILPSIAILDVVVKGSIAVFLFSYVNVNELTILSVIMLMWLLNYVIPSVFGSYFVLNFKLPKTEDI